jgi:hypothetical protein
VAWKEKGTHHLVSALAARQRQHMLHLSGINILSSVTKSLFVLNMQFVVGYTNHV